IDKRQGLALAIIISLVAAACVAPPTLVPTGKLKVVATFSVLGDLVQNVGGDKIELHTLVAPGVDTHTFEPSPADNRTLAEASLVFENGLGFETWLDDLYTSSGSKAERVAVSDGIEPLKVEGNDRGEFDPHVWHSAAHAIQMTRNIRDALAKADPANASAYQANAETYIAQLQELDSWILNEVKSLPEARRKLVTTHDTFGYFADRYGFEIIGTVLPSSTEGASPSAQEVAALVETVKAAGAPVVFAENVSSNTLLRQIADEAGITVVASLYTDALGPTGSDGDTYLKMMRYNVTTIVSELNK
ncbi:MAG: metal ABC transporter substrate-binding protein, partial [Chloroflexota bacterium]